MNSHLTRDSPRPGAGSDERHPGPHPRTSRPSAASPHRCSNGCLGSTVLHTKFYLFSAAGLRAQHRDRRLLEHDRATPSGCSGTTCTRSTGTRTMYSAVPVDVRADGARPPRAAGPCVFHLGPLPVSTFYPFRTATRSTDTTMQALQHRPLHGRHRRHGHQRPDRRARRDARLARGPRRAVTRQRVRQLYRRGCYVRILYSFMRSAAPTAC